MLGESDNIKGKTCLITGANRSLGRATTVRFAGLGGHVVLACRSGIPETGEYVRNKSGSNLVETAYIDLADPAAAQDNFFIFSRSPKKACESVSRMCCSNSLDFYF